MAFQMETPMSKDVPSCAKFIQPLRILESMCSDERSLDYCKLKQRL